MARSDREPEIPSDCALHSVKSSEKLDCAEEPLCVTAVCPSLGESFSHYLTIRGSEDTKSLCLLTPFRWRQRLG